MTQQELIEILERNGGIKKSRAYLDKKGNQISNITYDSRACTKNSAFFVKGVNFKTEYVLDAVKNGASIVIAETEYDTADAGLIIVPDVRHAMAVIAEEYFERAYESLTMIGITGTKGKTTTTTYINNILNKYKNKKTGLLSTIELYTGTREEEAHLSTPEAIELQRYIKEVKDNNLEYLTMEVSSQAYKKERILNMKFDIGVFLNISEDHISPAEHPNFVDYLNCKLEFIKNCKTVVVNYETDYLEVVLESAKNAKKLITYGGISKKGQVDYLFDNIRKEENYLIFDLHYNGEVKTYKTKMIGNFNVENAVAAIIIAKEFNVDEKAIFEGIKDVTVSGRMNVFSKETKTIIVDYAHNKLSFEKFFEAVKMNFKESKIISVFGAPGGKAYARRKDMAEIASKYSSKIYLTADDPQFESVNDICAQMITYITVPYEVIEDRETAISTAFKYMQNGDVLVLLAKGEDKYQQVRGKLEDYKSDIQIAKELTK